jgi:4-hydroxy-3-methylbut-2-enyl diphosphate reductase
VKKFDIPVFYRSSFIGQIKELRKNADPRKKDFQPTTLDFGAVKVRIARHFGFCYGVENAVEIAYRALAENPDKKVYLLSEMIHNPTVNEDLQAQGIQYIMDNMGNQLISWEQITDQDIVITPAFGTTIAIENILKSKNIEPQKYNTTCPFVEKVWNASNKIGTQGFAIVLHGKPTHEETRATFSHSSQDAPTVVVRHQADAQVLADIMTGVRPTTDFYTYFKDNFSSNFDPNIHLEKIGVVNQTTMLAEETQAIADFLKNIQTQKYGATNLKNHFADTRHTLCYATQDNQQATHALLLQPADLALVVGGYNSSNTSHLVELCEEKLPTYFIADADQIHSKTTINHYDYHSKLHKTTHDYLPQAYSPLTIVLSSGASCPDAMIDAVLDKILGFYSIDIAAAKANVLTQLQASG